MIDKGEHAEVYRCGHTGHLPAKPMIGRAGEPQVLNTELISHFQYAPCNPLSSEPEAAILKKSERSSEILGRSRTRAVAVEGCSE
jgi:hypothetical protein